MTTTKKKYFAAVASDGMRLVVWAKRWEAPDDLAVHQITARQRARVKAGDVSWPISNAPEGRALGK